MVESKLDILAPKAEQLSILSTYLEVASKQKKGEEKALPITLRTRTLIGRYLWHWIGLYNKEGISAEGAFLYYRKLLKEK